MLPINQARSQDAEPRRWTPMPTGVNVVGVGYGNTAGDIAFDPVVLLEDVESVAHTLSISYVRSFSMFGRSARFDAIVPMQSIHWKGLLDGERASATRKGMADPVVRLSINLYGAPAMGMEEFQKSAASQPANTVLGAGLVLAVPLGEYFEDKLLNLGQNRYMLRPQIGVLHTRGMWSFELTGSTYFYSDNDEFFGGNTLETDPVPALQAHVIRVIKPGVWASLSAAYGWRGASVVDAVPKRDDKRNLVGAVSFGFPVTPSQSIKVAYIVLKTNTDTGADLDTLAVVWSMRF